MLPSVYLATNVAETSLTVPGIVAVIDSGLVRRTSYHGGRAWLALGPVAQDSADQRAARAGRLGRGRCIRVWSAQAHLEARTPPAVHRESLVPRARGGRLQHKGSALRCGSAREGGSDTALARNTVEA